MYENDPDVVFVTESWTSSDTLDSQPWQGMNYIDLIVDIEKEVVIILGMWEL